MHRLDAAVPSHSIAHPDDLAFSALPDAPVVDDTPRIPRLSVGRRRRSAGRTTMAPRPLVTVGATRR